MLDQLRRRVAEQRLDVRTGLRDGLDPGLDERSFDQAMSAFAFAAPAVELSPVDAGRPAAIR
jgi:hypothetical protein